MSGISKFIIGIGAGEVLLGAVGLGRGLGNWGTFTIITLVGIGNVLIGMRPILGNIGQKVTLGLVIGVGVVVLVIVVLQMTSVIT